MILVLVLVCVMLCSCSKAGKVEELIAAIGEVTLEKEEQIVAAENAYNELSEEDKEKVENYDVLVEARADYDLEVERAEKAAEEARKREEEKRQATDLASRIITKMAKIYKNPLDTKINGVWYNHSDFDTIESWHFTFDLNVTNGYGISVHEYYGMTLYESDDVKNVSELDKTLSDEVSFYLMLGGGVNWRKDNISAMQYGEELDAAAIQQYFLKNYRG